MDPYAILALLALALVVMLGSGLWVAISLFLAGTLGLILNGNQAIGAILATTTWSTGSAWTLAALPLFIWMGEILIRTRLADDLFSGLSPWMSVLPGRLLHVNILGCGIFAAVSGSSAATAATIGRITLPELARRGYDEAMSHGTLAGAATLGLLIPPSLILIVYGVSAQVSVARLFIAGALPGLLLMLLFMGYTMAWAVLHPDRMPVREMPDDVRRGWQTGMRLMPVALLILLVIGVIYLGLATAVEAAAFGVTGALLLALGSGSLSRRSFMESLAAATRTTCMITFILAGAACLTVAMGFTGIPAALAEGVAALALPPPLLLAALTLLFVVLGCFLDGISMVVLTTSVLLPLVTRAGINPLWFGIYLVLVVEMAQITPPIGFNLFVIQGMSERDIFAIARAALPFFCMLLAAIVLIALFPQIVTWLPARMTGG